MKLVTFGCSFIQGDELTPDTPEYVNTHNIGGVINSSYKFEDYINYGNNGASNERIVLQIMEYLNSEYYDENDFILVGLSGLTRNLKYMNIGKYPFTIPHWSYNDHVRNTKHLMSNESDSKDYMNLVLKYEVNERNQIVQYLLNCLSIKSLLNPFKKYLVFQSIDTPVKLYRDIKYDKGWKEINLHHTTLDKKESVESKLFFDREFIEPLVRNGLGPKQSWINFSNMTYQMFVDAKKEYKMEGGHPSELGSLMYFEKYLKKYVDRIVL